MSSTPEPPAAAVRSTAPDSATVAAVVGTTEAPRRPGRPRDVRANRAILEATWAEVAAAGLGGLSVDKVAARAGVSKATIYRRWATKEALVLDAWRAADAPMDVPDTGSLTGDLVAMHNEFVQQKAHEPLAILLPQMAAAARQNTELNKQFHEFFEEQSEGLRSVLRNAQTRGEIHADVNLETLLMFMNGPFFLQLLLESEPLTLDALHQMLDMLLRGVAGPNAALAAPG